MKFTLVLMSKLYLLLILPELLPNFPQRILLWPIRSFPNEQISKITIAVHSFIRQLFASFWSESLNFIYRRAVVFTLQYRPTIQISLSLYSDKIWMQSLNKIKKINAIEGRIYFIRFRLIIQILKIFKYNIFLN